jgi:hypothetical protein
LQEPAASGAFAGPIKDNDRVPRLPAIAIPLLSWTLPRIGALKLTEALAVLAAPRAVLNRRVQDAMIRCYGPFMIGTLFAFVIAILYVGDASTTLTSEKAFYATPMLVATFTLVRTLVYMLTVAALLHYFVTSSPRAVSRTLLWTYYVTLFPGLLQMARLYTGIYFDLPFERPGFGPFAGTFDAGYIRLMGFEMEPLAYATSLVTVCCLSMHNGRRIPWMGLILLVHTFGAGAIAGFLLTLVVSLSKWARRAFVPLFALSLVLVSVYVVTNIDELLEQFGLIGSVMERIGAIYNCVSIWLDHPLGGGLGTYGFYMSGYDRTGIYLADQLDFHANIDPLEFLAAGGPLLTLGYLYTFWFVLKRSRSYWLSIACMSLMIQSASAYMLFNPALMVVFAMLLAGAEPVPAAARRRPGWLPRISVFSVRSWACLDEASRCTAGDRLMLDKRDLISGASI